MTDLCGMIEKHTIWQETYNYWHVLYKQSILQNILSCHIIRLPMKFQIYLPRTRYTFIIYIYCSKNISIHYRRLNFANKPELFVCKVNSYLQNVPVASNLKIYQRLSTENTINDNAISIYSKIDVTRLMWEKLSIKAAHKQQYESLCSWRSNYSQL